jgi:hypothetical protein
VVQLRRYLGWSPPGGRLTAYHLYLVYTDEYGRQFYCRGGPQNDVPSFGNVIVESGPYVPGTVDWDPDAVAQTLVSGLAAHRSDACLERTLRRIAALDVRYDIGGPNSNTVVRTLLEKCGLPVQQPASVAPGFGHPNLLREPTTSEAVDS